ncbi:MAG: hypothetical protein ABIY51_03755 [Ferruginibacter sp.]
MPLMWDSLRLGYVQKGLGGQVATVKPSKHITAFLEDHFNKLYKKDFEKDGASLLWVVKDLRIAERTFFTKEYAYTRFDVDAYISGVDNTFYKIAAIDTIFVLGGAADATAWHGENIESFFYQLLLKGFDFTKKGIVGVKPKTLSEIVSGYKKNDQLPILTEHIYTEGVYTDFEEFLQNKPSIISFETELTKEKQLKLWAVNGEQKTEITGAWGFSKFGEIYKLHELQPIAIQKLGNGFIISDYVEKASMRNSKLFFASFGGALTGGIVGGVLAGAAVSGNKKNRLLLVSQYPYLKKRQPEATRIDMNTGEFTF